MMLALMLILKKNQLASLLNTGDWICGEIFDFDDDVLQEVAREDPSIFGRLDGGYEYKTAMMLIKANPEVYIWIARKLDDLTLEEEEKLQLEVVKRKPDLIESTYHPIKIYEGTIKEVRKTAPAVLEKMKDRINMEELERLGKQKE
jgi:hypothetical protein